MPPTDPAAVTLFRALARLDAGAIAENVDPVGVAFALARLHRELSEPERQALGTEALVAGAVHFPDDASEALLGQLVTRRFHGEPDAAEGAARIPIGLWGRRAINVVLASSDPERRLERFLNVPAAAAPELLPFAAAAHRVLVLAKDRPATLAAMARAAEAPGSAPAVRLALSLVLALLAPGTDEERRERRVAFLATAAICQEGRALRSWLLHELDPEEIRALGLGARVTAGPVATAIAAAAWSLDSRRRLAVAEALLPVLRSWPAEIPWSPEAAALLAVADVVSARERARRIVGPHGSLDRIVPGHLGVAALTWGERALVAEAFGELGMEPPLDQPYRLFTAHWTVPPVLARRVVVRLDDRDVPIALADVAPLTGHPAEELASALLDAGLLVGCDVAPSEVGELDRLTFRELLMVLNASTDGAVLARAALLWAELEPGWEPGDEDPRSFVTARAVDALADLAAGDRWRALPALANLGLSVPMDHEARRRFWLRALPLLRDPRILPLNWRGTTAQPRDRPLLADGPGREFHVALLERLLEAPDPGDEELALAIDAVEPLVAVVDRLDPREVRAIERLARDLRPRREHLEAPRLRATLLEALALGADVGGTVRALRPGGATPRPGDARCTPGRR